MQTPPAITAGKLNINFSTRASVDTIMSTLFLYKYKSNPTTATRSLTTRGDRLDPGYILMDDKRTLVSKAYLLKLIADGKAKALIKVKSWKEKDYKDFQLLVNGVFQAEGYIGGSFPSLTKSNFTPTCKIRKNASLLSIEFCCLLWLVLDKKFSFSISKTSKKNWHIGVETSSWDTILKLKPYFSYLYGYKHRGFNILKDMRP